MLAITFKNVGHGDTIIVEWQNDLGEHEMGIIDCHQVEGRPNPAIEHIKKKNYKKIRFMILSHPHTDHFSGFPSLLAFCKNNHITIERFWHTAFYDAAFISEFFDKTTPDNFFDSFVSQKRDRIKLRGLFREIDNLHGGTVLKKAGIANDTSWLNLNKKLRIEFLSPSGYDELKKYCSKIYQLIPEEKFKLERKENNPEANLLSAVIMIKTDNWHVLLTSDAVKSTIERLYKSDLDRLNNRSAAVQIPHHGSNDSHFEEFWHKISNREELPAFVSVGRKYDLPSKEVIRFFDKNYKEIHSTNFVGGFREYFEDKHNKAREMKNQYINSPFYIYDRHFLDINTFSKDFSRGFMCGEKQISIQEDGFFTIETQSAYA
jgi:beta-lactamase superfamily II metal-dependent hydrolase